MGTENGDCPGFTPVLPTKINVSASFRGAYIDFDGKEVVKCLFCRLRYDRVFAVEINSEIIAQNQIFRVVILSKIVSIYDILTIPEENMLLCYYCL